MLSPNCPNCRERMSLGEVGLDGIWSCIYCEGAWLSAPEVQRLVAPQPGAASASRASPRRVPPEAGLLCPSCEASSLVPVSIESQCVHCCTSCNGVFFGKGVLTALRPNVGSGYSGPEVVLKAVAHAASWVALSILPLSS